MLIKTDNYSLCIIEQKQKKKKKKSKSIRLFPYYDCRSRFFIVDVCDESARRFRSYKEKIDINIKQIVDDKVSSNYKKHL